MLFKGFYTAHSRPLSPLVTITPAARRLPAFKPISSAMLKGSPELRVVQGRKTLTRLKKHTHAQGVDAGPRVCVNNRLSVRMRHRLSLRESKA